MIKLSNISKSYKTNNEENSALSNINLMVNKGDFIAITGPCGSGKSTLADIIAMTKRPTFGKYTFETLDISFMNEDDVAAFRNTKIGIVLQYGNLINELSIFKNLEIPLMYKGINAKSRKEKITNMLERFDMKSQINLLPKDLTRAKQQKAAIARAMLSNPELLVVDEPTGDLDTVAAKEILMVFQKINATGKTIIYSTQDTEIAKHANRVICLKDGVLVKDVVLSNPLKA